MTEDAAKKAAQSVIDVLNGRGGFDHWWHDIKAADKREIIKELAEVIWTAGQ